jgi:hypothetical protein
MVMIAYMMTMKAATSVGGGAGGGEEIRRWVGDEGRGRR